MDIKEKSPEMGITIDDLKEAIMSNPNIDGDGKSKADVKGDDKSKAKPATINHGRIDPMKFAEVKFIDHELTWHLNITQVLRNRRDSIWTDIQNDFGIKPDNKRKFNYTLEGLLIEVREVEDS